MENLRIESRPDGIWLVCNRGAVAKMTAGYGDTQQKDAQLIVDAVRLYNSDEQQHIRANGRQND